MNKLLLVYAILVVNNPYDAVSTLLPNIPVSFQDSFHCLVNGNLFTPSGPVLGEPAVSCTYNKKNGSYSLYLKGQRTYNGKVEAIWLKALKITLKENATYKLSDKSGGIYASWYEDAQNYSFTHTSEKYSGELTIKTLDEEKHIITGNFWFRVLLPDNKIIHVTNGRFNLIYN